MVLRLTRRRMVALVASFSGFSFFSKTFTAPGQAQSGRKAAACKFDLRNQNWQISGHGKDAFVSSVDLTNDTEPGVEAEVDLYIRLWPDQKRSGEWRTALGIRLSKVSYKGQDISQLGEKGSLTLRLSDRSGNLYEGTNRDGSSLTYFRVAPDSPNNDLAVKLIDRLGRDENFTIEFENRFFNKIQSRGEFSDLQAAISIAKDRMIKSQRAAKAGHCEDDEDCFFTTACCWTLSLPDDCWELQTLRRFRNNILPTLPGGKRDICRYERLAPQIVQHINERSASKEWIDLYARCILPCSLLITVGANRLAHRLYRKHFIRLHQTSETDLCNK